MVSTVDSLLWFVRGFDVRCVRERDRQRSPSVHRTIASAFSFCFVLFLSYSYDCIVFPSFSKDNVSMISLTAYTVLLCQPIAQQLPQRMLMKEMSVH
jgi:hypothetical protein